MTVTQRPPDRRLDVERADGTADATIAIDGSSYQCTETNETWRCELLTEDASPGGLFDTDAVDALAAALTDAADDYDFVVERRELVGVEARCLTTRRRDAATSDGSDDALLGESATLCVSAEGARLLTEVPSGTLRAVAYEATVPDDAFTLPAQPGEAPAVTGSTVP